jgi:ankyrin repeat protein
MVESGMTVFLPALQPSASEVTSELCRYLSAHIRSPDVISVEVINSLIGLGADPNHTILSTSSGNYFTRSPIGLVLGEGPIRHDLLRVLLNHGARIPWPERSREDVATELLNVMGAKWEVIVMLGFEDVFDASQFALLTALDANNTAEARCRLQSLQRPAAPKPDISEALFLSAIDTDHPDEFCRSLLLSGARSTTSAPLVKAATRSHPALKALVQGYAGWKLYAADALVAACKAERFASISFLLQNGTDVNQPDRFGVTPLEEVMGGTGRNSESLIEFLLDQGAAINSKGSKETGGLSPVIQACRAGAWQTVVMLMNLGADIHIQPLESREMGALEASCIEIYLLDGRRQRMKQWMIQRLLDIGVPAPVTKGRRRRLLAGLVSFQPQTLLEKVLLRFREQGESDELAHLEADVPIDHGPSPLSMAVKACNWDAIQLLVDFGEDVNSPATDVGHTPLQEAAAHKEESLELVTWLLDRGADVNGPPARRGFTALQGAAMKGHLKVATLLIDRGADVNAAPSPEEGRYAIEGAAERGKLDMVQLLLNAGAVGNPADERGRFARAIELAEERNNFGIARLLRSAEEMMAWENMVQV